MHIHPPKHLLERYKDRRLPPADGSYQGCNRVFPMCTYTGHNSSVFVYAYLCIYTCGEHRGTEGNWWACTTPGHAPGP
jgi:hypothetical protein